MIRFSILGVACVASLGHAQIPVPTQPPTPVPTSPAPALVDSIPIFERPNGSLMRTGLLTYALLLTRPTGQVVQLGIRTVNVTEASIGGTQAWLVAEARTGTVVESTDSMYLARADLAPVRWSATIGRAKLGASFSRDSAFGAMETYQGRSSFAMVLPPGALLSAGMVERVIELLPLRVGYRASASLVVVDGAVPRVIPSEIVVDREERVRVGARDDDCWVVAIRAGVLEQRLWVSKRDSRVIRVEQSLPDGTLSATLQS